MAALYPYEGTFCTIGRVGGGRAPPLRGGGPTVGGRLPLGLLYTRPRGGRRSDTEGDGSLDERSMPRGLFARPVSGGCRLHPAGQARPVLPGCPDASHPQGLPWGPGLLPSVWSVSYWQPASFLSRHRTVSHRTAPSGGQNLFPLRMF